MAVLSVLKTTTTKKVMENICRVCLSSSEPLIDIFSQGNLPDNDYGIAEMLQLAIKCTIKDDDELPKKICVSCYLDTQAAFMFKRKWEKSNKMMNVKVEKSENNAFIDSLELEDWELKSQVTKVKEEDS